MTPQQERGLRIIRVIAITFVAINVLSLIWKVVSDLWYSGRVSLGTPLAYAFIMAFYWFLYVGYRWVRWTMLVVSSMCVVGFVALARAGQSLTVWTVLGALPYLVATIALFVLPSVRAYYALERQATQEPMSLFRGPGV